MTVSTRLLSAVRPATWAAARGTGVSASISTTDSISAAGKATFSPARRTISICAMASALPAERAEQGGAVVTVDASVLATGFLELGAQAYDPRIALGGGRGLVL